MNVIAPRCGDSWDDFKRRLDKFMEKGATNGYEPKKSAMGLAVVCLRMPAAG